MRISCEFKCDRFPLAYHMLVVSLIKESLKKSDKEYFKSIYQYNEKQSNKKPKNFCFSVYLKDFEKKEDEFIINDRVIVNISTPDYQFFVNLYNGMLEMKEFKYKNFTINNVRIGISKEKQIKDNRVGFRTLSPICVKDRDGKPIDVSYDRFEDELNYIVDKTLESYRGYGLNRRLGFDGSKMRKTVVKQEIEHFTKETNKRFYYVNSYSGIFALEGDAKDLNDIYLLGLGFKRSQGFGMIDVLG